MKNILGARPDIVEDSRGKESGFGNSSVGTCLDKIEGGSGL